MAGRSPVVSSTVTAGTRSRDACVASSLAARFASKATQASRLRARSSTADVALTRLSLRHFRFDQFAEQAAVAAGFAVAVGGAQQGDGLAASHASGEFCDRLAVVPHLPQISRAVRRPTQRRLRRALA